MVGVVELTSRIRTLLSSGDRVRSISCFTNEVQGVCYTGILLLLTRCYPNLSNMYSMLVTGNTGPNVPSHKLTTDSISVMWWQAMPSGVELQCIEFSRIIQKATLFLMIYSFADEFLILYCIFKSIYWINDSSMFNGILCFILWNEVLFSEKYVTDMWY